MTDYQKSITINKPTSEVYAAITQHIADWWSNDLSGAAAKVDDSFNIAFGKTHKTFQIVEAVPGEKVVWKCVKAHINKESLKNKSEWEGTLLYWKISAYGRNTTLTLLHEGLNQSFNCYEIYEAGWNMFLASLQAYLEAGKGKPHLKAA